MKKNILILGEGGVANVVAHKCAQHNDVLGNICLASRSLSKCNTIIDSVERKNNLKDVSKALYSRQIDAMDIDATAQLIEDTHSEIVINVGSPYINMSVLQACLKTGAAYIDTAINEDPDKIGENPPLYANDEWKYLDAFKEKGLTAILGVGFDPGVVNAYCAYAAKHCFDTIDSIDIMDVNAGNHGKYFATNFDPEINSRKFTGQVWTWIEGKWVSKTVHSEKQNYTFPVVGEQTIYLTGHDELHSLSKNIKADTIRFWMGFGDHYINCFNALKNIGLLSEQSVATTEGRDVVLLNVVKACLPDPASLAENYTGKICIGNLVKGKKNGKEKEIFIYNTCDHEACYEEVESQATSYTAGVPAAATAILIANESWDARHMANVEELNPDPFIELLDKMGLSTKITQSSPGKPLKD